MINSATAIWIGSIREGIGNVSTQSKILQNVFFAKKQNISDGKGTNEYELMAASIAVSFINILGEILSKENFIYESIECRMDLTVFREISGANIELTVKASSFYGRQMEEYIEKAKLKCTVAKIITIPIIIKFTKLYTDIKR